MTTVIWIDWYSYHLSRFQALSEHEDLRGRVTGIELVGGCGVHKGFKFRDQDRSGLPVVSLFPQADWDSVGQLNLARKLWQELAKQQPSTVLIPGYYTLPALAAALWAKLNRKRSVLMSETTEFDYRRSGWREWCKRLLTQTLFDFGIAGGKPHVRYLKELGFSGDRIGHYYDVVDNQFYAQATTEARQQPEEYQALKLPQNYFLYVGRLSAEKNVDGLIREYGRYRAEGGTWSLVLVGDGPAGAVLKTEAQALGLASLIRFEGLKTARETIPYYAFASSFVLPSTREPWGLVVNEAMAASRPVLVSDRCGCAEDLVAEGQNGHMFNPGHEGELAGLMKTMEMLEIPKRKAMGQQSLKIISQYSPQHWAAEVARIARI